MIGYQHKETIMQILQEVMFVAFLALTGAAHLEYKLGRPLIGRKN